jgi:hypothetical protein
MTHDKRFKSAEDALKWLIAARDTAGTVGSVTGRCVADGELGLTPDGDVFGPSAEDRIHLRRDLEMVMDDGMDRMMKKVLDVYLDCECVRTYPEDEDGERRPGAVDYVVYWRRCSRQYANRLITQMLDAVEDNLWRYDMLRDCPYPVRGDIQRSAVDGGGGVRAVRQVVTEEDLEAVADYYSAEELEAAGIEIVREEKSCH